MVKIPVIASYDQRGMVADVVKVLALGADVVMMEPDQFFDRIKTAMSLSGARSLEEFRSKVVINYR